MTITALQSTTSFERLHVCERRRCAQVTENRVMKAIGPADLRLAAHQELCRGSRSADTAERNLPMSRVSAPDCIRPGLSADQRAFTSPMENPYRLLSVSEPFRGCPGLLNKGL